MRKSTKNRKHSLSTGKKLLMILLFSVTVVLSGIFLADCILILSIWCNEKIAFYYSYAASDLLNNSAVYFVLAAACIAISTISFFFLLRDYKESILKKSKKWYTDKMLIILIPFLLMMAIRFISFYEGESGKPVFTIIGFIMLPLTGVLVTPNVVGYALKDMKGWKSNMFYKKGNLHKFKADKDFYMVKEPVPFQKKIYLTVLRDEILNIGTVVFIALYTFIISMLDNLGGDRYKGHILMAIIHAKAVRARGVLAIICILLLAFGIPIMAYYITNAVYKLKCVRRREYITYHAIVNGVNNYKLRINHNSGRWYNYDYCSCVGIRPKKVHNTSAILIIVPDDLLLFPDKEHLTEHSISPSN